MQRTLWLMLHGLRCLVKCVHARHTQHSSMWTQSTALVLLIEWLFVFALSCLALVQHSTACQEQMCASQLCWVS